jgi:tetratricopeptide (TPR) repeat protein
VKRASPIALAVATLLAACAGPKTLPGDDQPTLASLAGRRIDIQADAPGALPALDEARTIAAYQQFLNAAPQAPQRPEALRRLGDLEMDAADRRAAEATGGGAEIPDYRVAIERYETFLKAYPKDPRNDRVLYQLARAQEQGGQLEAALQTLTKLVQDHPGTMHAEEAHFRRGEMLFAMRQYAPAEAAYATVLRQPTRTPFHERALYMQGWSLFKLGRIEEALKPFFGVLDAKLGRLDTADRDQPDLAAVRALSRADRELVEDSFRVLSLSLASLQGAESVPALIDSPLRESYQYRVYLQLADLYGKQERIKDAADTLAAFVRRQPLHAQAPLLQARVVEIYANNGFATLALAAKKDHVQRYGAESEFRRANPAGWQMAQPLVQAHLAELAQHHHALAQKSRATADVDEAVTWYRQLLAAMPAGPAAAQQRFLLAELLFENQRHAEAAVEYETVAYRAPGAARAADAGYSALLAYAALEKAATDRTPLQRQAAESALRFAAAFGSDARTGTVLANAAQQFDTLGEGPHALTVARQALALQPPAPADARRVAWVVIAHQAFDGKTQAQAEQAEQAYGEVLALTPEGATGRDAFVQRQAAAIYRQGELAREQNRTRDAAGHFARVANLPPLAATATLRASALYDRAATLIALKDWPAAALALEDFRRLHGGHTLQAEVPAKLSLVYLELGRGTAAAAELERVANSTPDATLARGALWQAAELHQQAAREAAPKSAALATATRAWERYLQLHSQPLEPAVSARWQLAALARQDNQTAKATAWLRAVQQADAQSGEARTPRTRSLGGQAALQLAAPLLAAYQQVPLTEPLQRQLKLKKARMETLLKAYADAAEVGALDVTTQATFQTGALYQDFGAALMKSQRPKKLNKAELEQYNVMLEEQAFPFEEKAIELFETNARRTSAGVYDEWVRRSLAELARLKPVRYAKTERGAAAMADLAAMQAALERQPAQPALLNQLGIAQRQQGQFAAARAAYEKAIALDPAAVEPQLNLGILLDVYLGDAARAQALYQRCRELSPADATVLDKWLAEIQTRKPLPGAPTVARSASSEKP